MGTLIGSLFGIVATPIGLPGGASVTLALAALALVTILVVAVSARAAIKPQPSGSAIPSVTRRRSEQTTFVRLRDPDAAGRPRPRAPSVQPTAG